MQINFCLFHFYTFSTTSTLLKQYLYTFSRLNKQFCMRCFITLGFGMNRTELIGIPMSQWTGLQFSHHSGLHSSRKRIQLMIYPIVIQVDQLQHLIIVTMAFQEKPLDFPMTINPSCTMVLPCKCRSFKLNITLKRQYIFL